MAAAAREETPNIAGDYAANILSNPTEGQQENDRGISNGGATARTDVTATSANDNPRSGDVGRSGTSRQMTGEQSHSSGQDRHNNKANDADRSDGPQDLSAREARDGFPDDGQGNGI
jgi:hypothetical protein